MDVPKQLPPLKLPLWKMTQHDLQEIIPRLICLSTGCKKPEYGKATSQPGWWPQQLPWDSPMAQPKATRSGRQAQEAKKYEEALRDAVRACYRYYKKEELLRPSTRGGHKTHMGSPGLPPSIPSPNIGSAEVLEEATRLPESACAAEPIKAEADQANATGPSVAAQPFQMLYICLCEEEFPHKAQLLAHQRLCQRRKEMEPRDSKSPPTPTTAPTDRFIQSRVLCTDTDEPKAISRVKFMEMFGLYPPEKIPRQSQYKASNVDYDVIEIEDDEVEAKLPPTPKTPKSLISQLSRDLSPTSRPRRYVDYQEERGGSDSDNESVESGEHQASSGQPRRNCLVLSIDYCSPLGQRVKKQLEQSARDLSRYNNGGDSDGEDASPRSYEEYCSTPKKSQLTNMVQKLRNRPNVFPITFKKSKKHSGNICHQYKFTARQRYEFYLTKESGLDRRSRRLKRKYFRNKCTVRLERLSEESIKRLTARKPRQMPQYMYTNCGQKNTSLMSNEKQLQQLIALHQANRSAMVLTSNNIQGALQYKPHLIELHNSTNISGAPIPTAIYRNQTPSPAASNLLRAVCNPQAMSPHTPSYFYGNTWNMNQYRRQHQQQQQQQQQQRQGGGVNITRPPTPAQADTICIDSDDDEENIPSRDDVVSISSTESETSGSGSRKRKRNGFPQPPSKRPRPEAPPAPAPAPAASPMLLFKCHLCHAEITCKDNFAAYIQRHFRQKHQVTNINLIEHTDANGHKVVSIVEEAMESPSPPPPPPQSQPPVIDPTTRRKLFREKPGPLHSKRHSRHQSSDSSSHKEIICLD